jgi:hypothetical protein
LPGGDQWNMLDGGHDLLEVKTTAQQLYRCQMNDLFIIFGKSMNNQ